MDPDADLARLPEQDFAAIFTAMGGQAETITKPGDLRCVGPWLRDAAGPVLLDCISRYPGHAPACLARTGTSARLSACSQRHG